MLDVSLIGHIHFSSPDGFWMRDTSNMSHKTNQFSHTVKTVNNLFDITSNTETHAVQ